MCGIYGMVSLAGAPLRHPEVLDRMGAALRHRGPDGRSILRTSSAAMGVERLRIVDLHPRADQPFTDPEQRIWAACNGQIYNAPALREALSGYPYRSRGDVEPIVPLYLEAGSQGLARLDGMFALSIWDERRKTLVLARDRAGEKPLFYSEIGGELWYASEVQALLEHPHATRDLDLRAVHDYLVWGYVREPRTMFARIRKIEAGTIVTIDRRGKHVVRYFDPVELAHSSARPSVGRSSRGPVHPPIRRSARGGRDAAEHLRRLLENAVIRQTRADVPVGVFASGGLDSSVLAALTARVLGPRRTHTFTLRFADPLYDESRFARQVAESLGTRHREVPADQDSLSGALDTVARRVAEPLADPAILPTWLLARAAREDVGVVLSGEGADELFGGYPTYQGHRLAEWYRTFPAPIRYALRRVAAALPVSTRPVSLELLLKRFVHHADRPWFQRHLAWFGTGLVETGALRGDFFSAPPAPAAPTAPVSEILSHAMLLDYQSYLRDDLLVKMDRATMLAGLEGRAPYLDTALQQFALALPADMKLHGLSTKWALKQAARAWLPHRVVHRRKRGFSVPVAQWLNQGLAAEANRLLDPGRLRRRGWLHPDRVGQLLSEHRGGRANHARPLWAILVLESWLEQWATPEGPA